MSTTTWLLQAAQMMMHTSMQSSASVLQESWAPPFGWFPRIFVKLEVAWLPPLLVSSLPCVHLTVANDNRFVNGNTREDAVRHWSKSGPRAAQAIELKCFE